MGVAQAQRPLEEVELMQHGPELTVTGQKKPEENDRKILHRGLATGNFKQVFRLPNTCTNLAIVT